MIICAKNYLIYFKVKYILRHEHVVSGLLIFLFDLYFYTYRLLKLFNLDRV